MTPHHPHLKYPPPIIPPLYMSLIEMKNNNPSTSTYNTNSSSTHTLPPFHPPPHINRNTPNPPHEIKSCRNPPYEIQSCHAIDQSASIGSRAPSLNSNFPSAVKSSIEYYSCAAPETIPSSHTPFHTSCDFNPSTDSTASSLTLSHRTIGESSAVHFASYSHHHCCLSQRIAIPYQHLTRILLLIMWERE